MHCRPPPAAPLSPGPTEHSRAGTGGGASSFVCDWLIFSTHFMIMGAGPSRGALVAQLSGAGGGGVYEVVNITLFCFPTGARSFSP